MGLIKAATGAISGALADQWLEAFEAGSVVDAEALKAAGVIKKVYDGVKILGNGEITKALTVKAAKFSESAKQKIEAAGGKAEVI